MTAGKVNPAEIRTPEQEADYTEQLLRLADTPVRRCIQCGRCTGACPMAKHMDLVPNRLVWELKNGRASVVLAARSPWDCLSCFACVDRCPRGVEPAKLVEAIRVMVVREKDGNHLTPDAIPALLDDDMPQQALMSALRKYAK